MNPLYAFMEQHGITRLPPATEQQIAEFEQQAGFSLTLELRRFYLQSNGAILRPECLQVLALDQVLDILDDLTVPCPDWHYFPLTDHGSATRICLLCGGPLAGHVVRLHESGLTQLAYRRLVELFFALTRLLKDQVVDPDYLTPSFVDSTRSDRDIEIGKSLLELAKHQRDMAHKNSLLAAICLLDKRNLYDIVALLNEEDEQVELAAAQRLAGMDDPMGHLALECHEKYTRGPDKPPLVNHRDGTINHRRHTKRPWLNSDIYYRQGNGTNVLDFLIEGTDPYL